MKICILSDSHDNRELLKKAGADAHKRGAEAIIHAGDVVAPSTLVVLVEYAVPVHVICGNNTGDLNAMYRLTAKPENQINFYGHDATIELGGKKIFVVHYPHYAEGMALTGKWDIVCYGHSHDVSIKTIKNIL
ncbi:MAG: YfcE family phosphodiesterase, partial [Spirochaetia bacterium]|nr:YfcE family phosphodiesterase [Spirochaetia bacterium]